MLSINDEIIMLSINDEIIMLFINDEVNMVHNVLISVCIISWNNQIFLLYT